MKKISKPIRKKYRPIVLRTEDLEEVVDSLIDRGLEVTLRTDTYEFSKLHDLQEKHHGHKVIRTLTVKVIKPKDLFPFVELEFTPVSAELVVKEETDFGVSVFFHLDKILQARQLRMGFLYTPQTLLLWSLLGVPFVNSMINLELIRWLHIGISLSFLVYWIYITLYAYSRILLVAENDRENFFIRNRDQLILVFLSAMVPVIFTIISHQLGWLG